MAEKRPAFVDFVASTGWASTLAICIALLTFLSPLSVTDVPRDSYRLAPGATAWEPLGQPEDLGSMIDAIELPSGSLAATSVVTFDPSIPRPCSVFEPRTKLWTRDVAAIPTRSFGTVLSTAPGVFAASLGSATVVFETRADGTCAVREDARELPPLPVVPESLSAVRLSSGALLTLALRERAASAFRLDPGAAAWSKEPPLPSFASDLSAGPGDTAVATGVESHCLYSRRTWRALPPLPERRNAGALVVARDGTVYVLGGFLEKERTVVNSGRVVLDVGAALTVVVLVVLGILAVRKASPRPLAVALGVFVGGCVFPALVGGLFFFVLMIFGAHY